MKLCAKHLPLLSGLLGGLALLLRLGLYLLGRDEKGLLISGHPLDILTWIVTAAALLLMVLGLWPLHGSKRYEDNFPPSAAAAAGTFLMAGCTAATVLLGWQFYTRLELIRNVCGLLAAAGLVWVGMCRLRGKQPFFGCHAMVCLYLTLYAVSHYQAWCSQPQLQNYLFSMAGILALALFGYYQTAFDVGMGKRRMQLFMGLAAAFFCIAALAVAEDVLLYLGGALWTLTNLCRLTPVLRRPNPFAGSGGESAHETA